MKLNPLLLTDFYKVHHNKMYPDGMTKLYSNFTPRKSRIEGVNEVVVFGIQHFIKEYLIKAFNENFFMRPLDDILLEYKKHVVLDDYSHVIELHKLQYLPLEIKSLDEGTFCPIGVPMLTITNTHSKFGWLVNYVETLISCSLWQAMTSATIARKYYDVLSKYAIETAGDNEFVQWQGHDFSMRGMSSPESAILSGIGHLLSFTGTDTIPAIYQLEESYNATGLIGGSVPACYDNQTELLTNKGWKLFKDLDKTELVAQYDTNKTISFVKPLEYFKDRYKGKMIKFHKPKGYKYIDAVVTPNHKMVRINKSDIIDLFEAGDFSYKNRSGYSHRNNIVISGATILRNKGLSNLDKLKIAFQADGSFPSHKDDYTGERGNGFPIRFSFKKERKKDRLEFLLKSENIDYTLSKNKNGYYSFWVNVPEKFVKDFSWIDIENFSFDQCTDFVNELQYWDGTVKNNCIVYSSINKDCIDTIQAICSISNYKTHYNEYNDPRKDNVRKTNHTLIIKTNKIKVKGGGVSREEIDYDDYVYCVSVPSKMIITRRNNTVLICGNTEHSVMCMGTKETEIETFKRLLNLYPTGILSIVSDTWSLWDVCLKYLPQLKEQILARDGKLVVRPDSGDPVDILCGNAWRVQGFTEGVLNKVGENGVVLNYIDNKYYKVKLDSNYKVYGEETTDVTPANKGVIELLWDVFGGTINEQGYKVLDSHIGAIYGDSITLDRAKEICERLKAKGFASTNIVLGIGSYTYQYNTRDTFGFAMKATYGEVIKKNGHKRTVKDNNGIYLYTEEEIECREIFKDPITDDGTKKSKKGLLQVTYDDNMNIVCLDQCTREQENGGLLKTVFKDGKLTREITLEEIRQRVNK